MPETPTFDVLESFRAALEAHRDADVWLHWRESPQGEPKSSDWKVSVVIGSARDLLSALRPAREVTEAEKLAALNKALDEAGFVPESSWAVASDGMTGWGVAALALEAGIRLGASRATDEAGLRREAFARGWFAYHEGTEGETVDEAVNAAYPLDPHAPRREMTSLQAEYVRNAIAPVPPAPKGVTLEDCRGDDVTVTYEASRSQVWEGMVDGMRYGRSTLADLLGTLDLCPTDTELRALLALAEAPDGR